MRPRRLKLGIHMDSGQLYHVYQNQAADAYSSLYFFIFTRYLIIRSIFLIFAIYRSKVNTSLKNKICFENIYFPSKFIKLCPESLKEHTDKISPSSDETQTFY